VILFKLKTGNLYCRRKCQTDSGQDNTAGLGVLITLAHDLGGPRKGGIFQNFRANFECEENKIQLRPALIPMFNIGFDFKIDTL
jgi:hypothetical protein